MILSTPCRNYTDSQTTGAAASLKYAKPHELPSFPSVGSSTSAAGAAAVLAKDYKKATALQALRQLYSLIRRAQTSTCGSRLQARTATLLLLWLWATRT
jgi:hypothetical protein